MTLGKVLPEYFETKKLLRRKKLLTHGHGISFQQILHREGKINGRF